MQLRALINSIIHDASEDLRLQRAAVSEAFDCHLRELAEAKLRLEQHLQQVWGISLGNDTFRYLLVSFLPHFSLIFPQFSPM